MSVGHSSASEAETDIHAENVSSESIDNLFEKKFSFNGNSIWTLPPLEDLYTYEALSIPKFEEFKTTLNDVKQKLKYYPIELWRAHTKKINPSKSVPYCLKNYHHVDFVTQGWCKFFECLNSYAIVKGDTDVFRSVHLCEAPGAFVAALNHYLKLNWPLKEWSWKATSLNPYYEGNPVGDTILYDQLVLHTLDRWCFGTDFVGDIFNSATVESLQSTNKVDLVTADGSTDCSEAPEIQEESVVALHYAETIAAMELLAPGGTIVLKVFTLFEYPSICLIYLLACSFEHLHIFKPGSSKPGNSEVYVIGIGFKASDELDAYLDRIKLNYLHSARSLFPLGSLPASFIDQLCSCCKFFMHLQIRAIESNMANFDKPKLSFKIKQVLEEFYQRYVKRFNVQSISADEGILHNAWKTKFSNFNFYPVDELHRQRKTFHVNDRDKLVYILKTELEYLMEKHWVYCRRHNLASSVNFAESPPSGNWQESVSFIEGKPITRIHNSRFILTSLFQFLMTVVDVVPELVCSTKRSSDAPGVKTIVASYDVSAFTEHYDTYEKKMFATIVQTISEMQPNDELRIVDLFVLTHFLVGFMVLLQHYVFDIIEFSNCGQIMLKTFKTDGKTIVRQFQMMFQQRSAMSASANRTIVGIMNVKSLWREPLVYRIIEYNNYMCLKYCMNILDFQ